MIVQIKALGLKLAPTRGGGQLFSLLKPIDTKLGKWVADIKRQLGIATQVPVINDKVTVAKNKNAVLAQ
jgi:hypothetical protein